MRIVTTATFPDVVQDWWWAARSWSDDPGRLEAYFAPRMAPVVVAVPSSFHDRLDVAKAVWGLTHLFRREYEGRMRQMLAMESELYDLFLPLET